MFSGNWRWNAEELTLGVKLKDMQITVRVYDGDIQLFAIWKEFRSNDLQMQAFAKHSQLIRILLIHVRAISQGNHVTYCITC